MEKHSFINESNFSLLKKYQHLDEQEANRIVEEQKILSFQKQFHIPFNLISFSNIDNLNKEIRVSQFHNSLDDKIGDHIQEEEELLISNKKKFDLDDQFLNEETSDHKNISGNENHISKMEMIKNPHTTKLNSLKEISHDDFPQNEENLLNENKYHSSS